MNGPEHYATAEALLEYARRCEKDLVDPAAFPEEHARGLTLIAGMHAAAQVHATLAAAAATVDTSTRMRDQDTAIAWGLALSPTGSTP